MYIVKKLLFSVLFPFPLSLGMMTTGLVLLLLTKKQTAARVIITVGLSLLVVTSSSCTGDLLAGSLEDRYPPLDPSGAAASSIADAKWIVVLAASHHADGGLPANQQLSSVAMARLAEGLRLHRSIPGTRLLLSGGPNVGSVTGAQLLAEAASSLGEATGAIVLENESRDTEDEARFVHSIVGEEKLILVTSAFHMPRSMALFLREGMKPLAAPAERWVDRGAGFGLGGFFPSSDGLANTERAFHEYLGMAWSKVRGRG